MRDIGFSTLNKNNGIIKGEPSIIVKVSSFELLRSTMNYTLSILHYAFIIISCQVGTAGTVKMHRYKTESSIR